MKFLTCVINFSLSLSNSITLFLLTALNKFTAILNHPALTFHIPNVYKVCNTFKELLSNIIIIIIKNFFLDKELLGTSIFFPIKSSFRTLLAKIKWLH